MRNRKLLALLVLAVSLLVVSTGTVIAQDSGDIVIQSIWARPSASANAMMNNNNNAENNNGNSENNNGMGMSGMMHGQGTSAAYMFITNNTENDISLVGGESAVAGLVEIHENTIDENQVMRMRPVDGGIVVPAGETVELRPGGFHVMLMDLQQNIELETAFNLKLVFESRDDAGEAVGDPIEMLLGVPVIDMLEAPMQTDLIVEQVWARPTADEPMHDMEDGHAEEDDEAHEATHNEEMMQEGGFGVSAAFMYITNTSDEDVSLVGASTQVANIVEIHETRMTDEGVMQMRPLLDGLVIPAGETVELRPGGFHVMLMDLQDNLYNGTTLYLTLEFSNGESLVVGAPIEDRLGMMMGE